MINRIQETLEKHNTPTNESTKFLDLINTNFSQNNFNFPEEILLKQSEKYFKNRKYSPDSKGLLSARSAIAKLNNSKSENIIITASTSESYSLIFNSLMDKSNILLPVPGYPLFEYLADFSKHEIKYYDMIFENNWEIDIESIKNNIDENTKLIVLISPNNPTGRKLTQSQFDEICALANNKDIDVVIDEVFSIFNYDDISKINYIPLKLNVSLYPNVCFYKLNGISKLLALPDLKLAWIDVAGNQEKLIEIVENLEIINDVFLNANYLSQSILPELLESANNFQIEMIKQINISREALVCELERYPEIYSFVKPDSGIHCVIKIPKAIVEKKLQLNKSHSASELEEEFIIKLIEQKSLSVHPGYFYDIEDANNISFVISFLSSPERIREGIQRIVDYLS